MNNKCFRLWVSRAFIGFVFLINIQCALFFLVTPQRYVSGFELNGIQGIITIQGMGILFIMWNVPYLLAFVNPIRFRISLFEAFAMQFIGVVGESFLLSQIPARYTILSETLGRFVFFDGVGLLLLLISSALIMGIIKEANTD